MPAIDPPDDPTTYSGPWLRNQLLLNANYIASKEFPELWKWETGGGGSPNKLIVNHSDEETEEVYCRIVGIISDDRPYLETHGNFNPVYKSPMHKSKLQFSLKNPKDADFGKDFTLACKRMEAVQDKIATGRDRSWFLRDGTMRFSFPLWGKKEDGIDEEVEAYETELTENYNVRSDLTTEKLGTQELYQIRIMRVSRLGSDELIDPAKFPTVLPGALVDVTFVFRHHFIKGKSSSDPDVNTYTAHVQQVIILKPAPPAVRSPFQDRRKGGALMVSQSPRKSPSKAAPSRAEQVAAVDAFGPQLSTRAAEKRKRNDDEVVASSSKKSKEASLPS